ncbi:hypothetical protein PTTG_25729 [Puccinia triticina 1-1 BBBD Race 1]|uniref:Uncharacterized protein n=2 Tax=Puccinia triticina TaxID=208348 RepID=A0A180H1N4_PUCT1|nr:uncharacterized protein PtA15_8A409 [Puccinia triticina]OAV98283.1 hypothetical protein PTTG_25729 [Puccinia triticina 1-1 BBBD Race 1]WAQ87505.1 hypothetical protein PtA15_8A409 [Puccinia triticina]WAR57362.1 hypothetical protein PtB15_8B409 [Puccinia triticina]
MKYSLQDMPQISIISIGINLLLSFHNRPPTVLGAFRPNVLIYPPPDPPPFATGQTAPVIGMEHLMNINNMPPPVFGQPALYPQVTPEGFITHAPVHFVDNYQIEPFAGITYNGIVPHAIHEPHTIVENHYSTPPVLVPGTGYPPVPAGVGYPPANQSGYFHTAQYLPQVRRVAKLSANAPDFVPTALRGNPPKQSLGVLAYSSGTGRPEVRQDAGDCSHQSSSSKESLTNSKLPKDDGSWSTQPKSAEIDSEGGAMVQKLAGLPLLQTKNLIGSSSIANDAKGKSSSPTASGKLKTAEGSEVASVEEVKSLNEHDIHPYKEESQNKKRVENGQNQDTQASEMQNSVREKKELQKLKDIPTIDQGKMDVESKELQIDSQEEPKIWNIFPSDLKKPELKPNSKELNAGKYGDEEIDVPHDDARTIGDMGESSKIGAIETEKEDISGTAEKPKLISNSQERTTRRKQNKKLHSLLHSQISGVEEELQGKQPEPEKEDMGKTNQNNM